MSRKRVEHVETPLRLPGMNEYVKACRTNKYEAAKLKAHYESCIAYFLRPVRPFEHPVEIDFHWVEPNSRRDLDNIAAGKKFVLDAMVKCGLLRDDNRRHVTAFRDTFGIGKEPGVELTIRET